MYKMFRVAMGRRLLCTGFPPFALWNANNDDIPNDKIESLKVAEIGVDRLRNMFNKKDGKMTKELQSVISVTMGATVGGFLLGGLLRARLIPEKFIAENQATKFQNKFDAQRQLQMKFLNEFMRGGANLAWRLGAFCFMFQGMETCLYVYRGKYSISNFLYAGALTGFLFKANMGPKGAVAGSFAGAVLGSMYGSITILLLYLTGTKIENVYEIHASTMNTRRNAIKNMSTPYICKEDEELKKRYSQNDRLNSLLENEIEASI
ncbi:RPII140-upstream gene protein [Hylaeus anthracinus]|uniref:RPII140-upstream gene protein n=1 Tax=Hylaeus anthracinus TaxID=313031 RepID=UPI0023B9BEDE|nr:RPII140-upstream gene protein [Hylaeus anthracinus]